MTREQANDLVLRLGEAHAREGWLRIDAATAGDEPSVTTINPVYVEMAHAFAVDSDGVWAVSVRLSSGIWREFR